METFVVRVWSDPAEDGIDDRTLRGVVEHVRSGRSRPFGLPEELVEFVRTTAAQHPSRPDGLRADAIRQLLEAEDAAEEVHPGDG